MSAFENWKIVYQYEGFLQSIRRTFGFVYEKHIRPKLPNREPKYAKLNGVLASRADAKILDNYIGIINYEGPLIRGMNESIRKGDRVVIVGGGRGVSAVVAARLAGPEGHVTVYEGAKSMLSRIEDTLAINNISNAEIKHNIVSEAVSLYDDDRGASVISPNELPECDTLVLDCEGAELNILSELPYNPRSVVVETHGHYGAPTDEIKELLGEYQIVYEQSMSESKNMSVLSTNLKR